MTHTHCHLFSAVLMTGSAAVAGADLVPSTTSPDAGVSPATQTWVHARPLDPALANAGPAQHVRGSLFLNLNGDPDGDLPRDLAYTMDGTTVVIVNTDSDNITFVDVNTRTVTDTVAVGDYPSDVAVTPDDAYAIVPNTLSHTVSVIDIATRTLVADIPVTGQQPYRAIVTPDGAYAVVGVINDAVVSAFSIIDLDTLSEVSSFPSTPQGIYGFFFTPESGTSGALFTEFAVTLDGTKIILPDRGNSRVAIYDRASGAQLALLATSTLPTGVDISSDGTLAAIVHTSTPGMITKIDLGTLAVSGSFSTTDGIFDPFVRVTPDKTHVMAAISNNLIFHNLATGARTATIMTGTVGDIELSFDGAYAFVSNFNSRVIDVASQTLVSTLTLAACADAATSPTQRRAAALNNRFREDVHFYNINGASGSVEGFSLSGELPEGDNPRDLAISADGRLALACFNTSRNVAVIDLATNTTRSYIDVGERPLAAEITPDGHYAVVCATDADAVRIIDLASDTIVASLTIVSRPARVRISPDGAWAYVLNVAGTDRVSFIQLAGAASTIVSQLSGIQCGSASGYAYTEISGIELSHNGTVLAVCDSFNDFLRLYDTATRTLLASVPVGDFPIRVAFSPNDTRAYVTNSFSDNVSVVNVNGGSSSLIGSFGNMDFPLTADVEANGAYVYIGNAGTNPGIRVLDTATNTFVRTVLFPSGSPRDTYLSWTDDTLYAASTAGELVRLSAAGVGTSILGTTPLSGGPSDLVFYNPLGVAIAAQPVPDGVDIVQFGCVQDLDGDRVIGLADLSMLLTHYGTPSGATREDGDLDGDGDVDLADLSALLELYGSACP